ncbi:HAMP domain-containing sensor histidine kinase [Rhodanobacter sp. MP7CTX1]|uniref:ATP-binding protein n=1 Tax=Rhodanobacter sp. MP7CTX1 TaxID=2723084 RepID=UPI00160F8BEC|nr:signal transduction histidine kinase [Rhodanobacter sp. MP7CTX1]
MIQRLYMRIYLTTLASLAVVVILSALLWQFTAERSADADHDRFMGALVSRALPPDDDAATLQTSLAALVVPPTEGLALYDRHGVRLAGAGNQTGINGPAMTAPTMPIHANAILRIIRLDDGRVVVARMHTSSLNLHLGGLALLALIALAVALGTYPVVRRLTRRLEELAGDVDRFGGGDLAVRSPVSGQDEVSGLATSFNAMADRVAKLLEAHSRMLVNASHELRSPLARVRLALELYETAPRAELLQGMRQDCAEISEQIEEILLASKLETVDIALPRDTLDLAVLVAEECSRLDIAFEIVPAEVRGDGRLLRRLIRNLLENALKYGGHGVDARLALDNQGNRILQVSDRGPGITEAERERIFEPFYRPANTAETGNGWGLGLALVRQIASHHHGSISCLPRIDGGCVFELMLPLPGEAS